MAFGQNAQTASQGQSLLENLNLSDEDLMLVQALLSNGMFRDQFIQSCSAEYAEWLGPQWAEKTCSCAYENLVQNKNLLMKFLSGDESDSRQMGEMSYELVEKCLPSEFPPEMEKSIVRECMDGGASKSSCDCIVKKVKDKYTMKTLMKGAFQNPGVLEKEFSDIATQCGVK